MHKAEKVVAIINSNFLVKKGKSPKMKLNKRRDLSIENWVKKKKKKAFNNCS